MAPLPYVLIQNASSTGRYNVLDLQGGIAKEVTFLVTTTGSPTFSVDLEGGHASGPSTTYVPLTSVSTTGYVTVNTHWVRYLTANVTSLSGGTISVTVAPHPA